MWNLKCMVIPVISGATGNDEKLKEKPRNYTWKTFDRFTTENSYTWSIIHNTGSTAV